MKIGTALFTYHRNEHTAKVLEALSQNDALPEKLYLFQDGIKESTDYIGWNKVSGLIQNINWCKTEVCISKRNKGLADSVIDGVNYVLQECDAVIVLEDDCVPHPKFMSYMVSALNKYVENENIYSIGGYAWPVEVEKNGTDAYFTGRISSWGWGTWKNRWAKYEVDYQMLAKMKADADMSDRFHTWGEDLESHLLGNVRGTCNSWAVFWALTVIKNKGFCLAPYQSLIENIGFDGTGVHCGANKIEQKLHRWNDSRDMVLPDEIEFPTGYKESFSKYFSWVSPEVKLSCYNKILTEWLRLMQQKISIREVLMGNGISKVSIWGKGKLSALLLRELENGVEVEAIIESKPSNRSYQGVPIIDITEVSQEVQLVIVIPVYDMDKILKLAEGIISCRIVGIDRLITQCLFCGDDESYAEKGNF